MAKKKKSGSKKKASSSEQPKKKKKRASPMAKKKNPKRVAAGKKAARSRKKSKGGSKPKKKLISLSSGATVVGGVIYVTGVGRDAITLALAELNAFLAEFGVGPVSGIGALVALHGLSLLATAWPWFGKKYRAWLRSKGLKP